MRSPYTTYVRPAYVFSTKCSSSKTLHEQKRCPGR